MLVKPNRGREDFSPWSGITQGWEGVGGLGGFLLSNTVLRGRSGWTVYDGVIGDSDIVHGQYRDNVWNTGGSNLITSFDLYHTQFFFKRNIHPRLKILYTQDLGTLNHCASAEKSVYHVYVIA